MKIEEYLQLLSEGKVDEARKVRFSTIPSKLIKFIWLDESEKDEKKFLSLQREEIWFAQKDLLNDPYEYKGILLDRKKLSEAGYSPDVIEKYQTLFDFSDYGITCLSSNNMDYDYVTYNMACEYYRLGIKPIVRMAHEAGAVYKIGKKVLIRRSIFEAYLREKRKI